MRVNQTTSNASTEVDSTSATRQTEKAKAKKHEKSGASGEAAATHGAKVDLSSRGKDAAKARAAATEAPDVREEKIAALKKRIEAGKYHVDAEDVADKMVDEHLEMSGIG